jgi:hypothetical protein
MSTYEVLELRKNINNRQPRGIAKSTRQNAYLQDILVNKFMQKCKIDIFGPTNSKTKETEVRLHAFVIREFEKFI